MAPSRVENQWFCAEFPGPAQRIDQPPEELSTSHELVWEATPFGIFSVRLTRMATAAFVPVGAQGWVKTFGDLWASTLAKWSPERLDDTSAIIVGGATRQLAFKLDDEGPCGAFARVIAAPDGAEGRVLVASAIVDWTPEWETAAFRFLDSVRVVWSPPS